MRYVRAKISPTGSGLVSTRATASYGTDASRRLAALQAAGITAVILRRCPEELVAVRIVGYPQEAGQVELEIPSLERTAALHGRMVACYGGLAALELLEGGSTDACEKDVEDATRLALTYITITGTRGTFISRAPVSYTMLYDHLRAPLPRLAIKAIERLLGQAFDEARHTVKQERRLIEAITDALIAAGKEKPELLAEDIHALRARLLLKT